MLKLVHAFDMLYANVVDYYNSFDDKWNDLNNYAIYLVGEGFESYYDCICTYERNLYYLVDSENPDYILGYGAVEDSNIIDYHDNNLNFGNIGCSVRPSERNKGYGTELVRLLLIECEKHGMSEVCVSCHVNNLASKKVIENNKGKLEKEFLDMDTGKNGLKYWIKLHPKLTVRLERKFKPQYFINYFR